MGRKVATQALVGDRVMGPGPTVTLVRIQDDEGLYFTASLGGMPLCPHRKTWAEVEPLVRRVVEEHRLKRQTVKMVVWDGQLERAVEDVPVLEMAELFQP